MTQANSVRLTKKLIFSLAALLLWIALVTGGFSLVIGSTAVGILWIGFGLAIVVALLQGGLMSKIEGRRVPVASIGLILVIIALIAISELVNLFITKPVDTAAYIFDIAYSLGVVIFGGYAALQLIRSPRTEEVAKENPQGRG
jgi:hypothetical protein